MYLTDYEIYKEDTSAYNTPEPALEVEFPDSLWLKTMVYNIMEAIIYKYL